MNSCQGVSENLYSHYYKKHVTNVVQLSQLEGLCGHTEPMDCIKVEPPTTNGTLFGASFL